LLEKLKIEIPSSSHKRRKNMSFSCLFKKKFKKLYARNDKNAFAKVLAKRP
jgi:hypothetical protein